VGPPWGNSALRRLAQGDVGLVAGHVEADVQEAFCLPLHGLHHGRGAMARIHHADATGEVDQFAAVRVRDQGALRLHGRCVVEQAHAVGHGGLAAGDQVLALGQSSVHGMVRCAAKVISFREWGQAGPMERPSRRVRRSGGGGGRQVRFSPRACLSLQPQVPGTGRVRTMPKVTIDNIEIDVPEGTTILQAARMIGERDRADRHVVPPTMCYHFAPEGQRRLLPYLHRESGARAATRTHGPCPSRWPAAARP
jgi:hypothetical protein